MGFWSNLIGKSAPRPVVTNTAEEKAAFRVEYIDNMLWMAQDEMRTFVPQIAAHYAKGGVKGFDNNNVEAQRVGVEQSIDLCIGHLRESLKDPVAEEKFDEIRNGAVDRLLTLLKMVPSTPTP